MARASREFEAFGVKYRTVQFAAVEGLGLLALKRSIHPLEFLRHTEAYDEGLGGWVALNSREAINMTVVDLAGVLAPRLVLRAITSLIHDFSFDFAANWKGVRVPMRFQEGGTKVESKNIDPMISALVNAGVATLRELEEYYSLEDSFKLFDAITMNGVNDALAQERAMSKVR